MRQQVYRLVVDGVYELGPQNTLSGLRPINRVVPTRASKSAVKRFRKPANWPRYMEARALKNGQRAYYWRPPTWARKAGCRLKAKPLGSNVANAKSICNKELNPALDTWRAKRKTERSHTRSVARRSRMIRPGEARARFPRPSLIAHQQASLRLQEQTLTLSGWWRRILRSARQVVCLLKTGAKRAWQVVRVARSRL